MKIYLEEFTDAVFQDFFDIYLEEHGKESVFDPELRERVARFSINPEHSLVRGIWQEETGCALGYCEIQDIKDPEWEVGIYILERYRYQGVGKAAMRLFLDELAALGRHAFAAKILVGNVASRRLFEGLGAQPVGIEVMSGVFDDGFIEREIVSRKDIASSDELVRLQIIEGLIRETKKEVCVYRIEWPPNT